MGAVPEATPDSLQPAMSSQAAGYEVAFVSKEERKYIPGWRGAKRDRDGGGDRERRGKSSILCKSLGKKEHACPVVSPPVQREPYP